MDPNETTALADSTQPMRARELAPMAMRGFALAPTTFDEAWRMAQILAKTDFPPKDMRGRPEAIIAALAMAAEVGLSPMQGLQSIAVINGRPSLWGDGQLGICQRDPAWRGKKEWYEGELGDESMTAFCTVKRAISGGEIEETTAEYSIADAKVAKIWQKRGRDGQDTPWITNPKRMLKMRARAFALRDAFADLLKGLGSAEEMADVTPEKNVTPPPEATTPEDQVLEQLAPEAYDRLASLKKQLKWTGARLEVERKTVGFDDAKLLEKMEAEVARGGKKRPQAEPIVAEGVVVTETAIEQTITKPTNAALFASLAAIGVDSKPARIAFAKDNGVEVTSYSKLTEAQGRALIDDAHRFAAEAQQAAAEESGSPRNTTEEPCPACLCGPGTVHFYDCPEAQPRLV
jgi:hypothetical protein